MRMRTGDIGSHLTNMLHKIVFHRSLTLSTARSQDHGKIQKPRAIFQIPKASASGFTTVVHSGKVIFITLLLLLLLYSCRYTTAPERNIIYIVIDFRSTNRLCQVFINFDFFFKNFSRRPRGERFLRLLDQRNLLTSILKTIFFFDRKS